MGGRSGGNGGKDARKVGNDEGGGAKLGDGAKGGESKEETEGKAADDFEVAAIEWEATSDPGFEYQDDGKGGFRFRETGRSFGEGGVIEKWRVEVAA